MAEQKPPPRVACPACGKPVSWIPENRYRPFCSERCRQMDMGAWAAGDYRVPAVDDTDPLSVQED